jgi:hypothetical protein
VDIVARYEVELRGSPLELNVFCFGQAQMCQPHCQSTLLWLCSIIGTVNIQSRAVQMPRDKYNQQYPIESHAELIDPQIAK